MSGHDEATQLELELAALGELPETRVAELEALGLGDAIAELRAQNMGFHELHDRDAMLKRIARRHEPRSTPMIDPRRIFSGQVLAAASVVVALSMGYIAFGSVKYDRVEPVDVGGADVPKWTRTTGDTTVLDEPVDVPTTNGRFVDGRPDCDMTIQWTATDRLMPDPNPPEALNAYTIAMLACLKDGVDRVVGMGIDEIYSPPRELVYGCLQDFGFACAALGTLAASGPAPFRDGYLDAASLRLDADGRTWIWGELDTKTSRFGAIPDSQPITELPPGATSLTDAPKLPCDPSRTWTERERAAHHPESIMLASTYRRSMLTCLDDGLKRLTWSNSGVIPGRHPLSYACGQDYAPACAVMGATSLVGRLAVSRNQRQDENTRGEDRYIGARYMHKACALEYKPACNLLARQLDGDRELREELGYDPELYRVYGQPMFDGVVPNDEGDLHFDASLTGFE